MRKLLNAFVFACKGLCIFFSKERNGQIQLIAGALATFAGFGLGLNGVEWVAILGCVAIVLSFEMINSAIEKLCNLVQPSFHPQVKAIKDIAAAAVLWSCIISVLIAGVIFIPKIIQQLS